MLPVEFAYVAAVINAIGAIGYILATLRGRARPNRVTVFLWAFAGSLAFAAQLAGGATTGAILTFSAALGPALIFLASFRSREAPWKLGFFDYGCGTLSLVGLGAWLYYGETALGVLFAILADIVASIPTFVKSWRAPYTEHLTAYWLTGIAATLTLFTLDDWGFTSSAFAIYLVAFCVWIVGLITSARLRKRKQQPRDTQSEIPASSVRLASHSGDSAGFETVHPK